MDIIKGMLVDDEVNILRNLRTVIPWEALGIEIIGLANDGGEAWDLYEAHHPDIILCDIRMPVMNGTELVKKIAEREEQSEIIMLTGYEDFEYMRSSIQAGVRDYLLKPIDYGELRDVVEEAVSDIRTKQLKASFEAKKQGRLAHLAYERSLHDALMGYFSTSPWIWQDRAEDSDTMMYQLLVVDMDQYSQKVRFWNEEDRKLWNFAVNNILSEALLDESLSYAVLQMREGEWCICIERQADSPLRVQEWAEQLVTAVYTHLKLGISIGAFKSLLTIEGLARGYKMVQRDLHLKGSQKEKSVVLTRDITRDDNDVDYFMWQKVEAIVSAVKNGHKDETEAELEDLRKNLKLVPEASLVHVEQILHYLVLHLLREMKELRVIDEQGEETVWKSLKDSMGNEDLFHIIQKLVNDSIASLLNKKSSETLMISAKDYIDHHLGDDIGIDHLADYLGISASYFSMLFKPYFKETFVEYVTRKRLEQAKSLMQSTSLSIAKIAEQLGYSDRRYFTKVFQKYFGMRPSEYRDQVNH